MTKVTPQIDKFIQTNCALSPAALRALILKKFNIPITERNLAYRLKKARAEAQALNNAKVEAVREKILGDGGLKAEKYLGYLNDNIETLHSLLINAKEIKVEDVRDLVAVSASLQKSVSVILDFVKPQQSPEINVSFKPDLSKLSDEELDLLERIASKLEESEDRKSNAPST